MKILLFLPIMIFIRNLVIYNTFVFLALYKDVFLMNYIFLALV